MLSVSGDNGCHRWCGIINVCNHLTNNKYLSTADFVFTTILLFNTLEIYSGNDHSIWSVMSADWLILVCWSYRVTSPHYLIPSFHFHFNGMFVRQRDWSKQNSDDYLISNSPAGLITTNRAGNISFEKLCWVQSL